MKQEDTIKKDIKKLQQSKQFLTIMVLLFVVLFFWVTVSLITSQTSERVDPQLQVLSQPLTPVIDTEVFDTIAQKREYSQSELSAFTIFKVLVTRDGRTQRVVPLEITIEDLEPSESAPESSGSLLQEEVAQSEEESTNTLLFDLSDEDETLNTSEEQ